MTENFTGFHQLLFANKTDGKVAAALCAQDHERWCTTTPTNPPVIDFKEQCCVCWTARKMMRLLCLCVRRSMNVFTAPHPTATALFRVAQSDEIRVAQGERPKCEVCAISGRCLKWCVWCCHKWCGYPEGSYSAMAEDPHTHKIYSIPK